MSCVENETNNMLIYALNLSKYNLIKKNNDNKQLNLEINTNILKNKDKDNYVKLSYTSYMDYIFCPFFYKLNYINNFKTKKMNEKYFGDSAHICIWYIINTLKENNIKKQNVDIEKIIDDAINNHAFFPDNTNEYNKNCSELKEILLKNFIPYINNCDIDKITSELVFK
jgi:hypothetical protein